MVTLNNKSIALLKAVKEDMGIGDKLPANVYAWPRDAKDEFWRLVKWDNKWCKDNDIPRSPFVLEHAEDAVRQGWRKNVS